MRAAAGAVVICVVIAVGILGSESALAQPASAPSPTPSPSTSADPSGWLDVGGRVRTAISEWFGELVASALKPTFDLIGRTVFSTPSIPDNPRIKQLWLFSLAVANAALVVFVLAGAASVTASGGLESRVSAKELLPRLLTSAAAANLSWLAMRELIEMSNALSRAVLGTVDAEAVGVRMAESIFVGASPNPFLAILALVVVILAVLVVVTYVVRVAVVVILAAGAPLLLITHSLPQSDSWARLWWRAMLALLAVPVAQSFVVVAAFQVFLGDSILGFTESGLIDLLVLGSLLFLLFKLPIWALETALGGAVSSAWQRGKRVVVRSAKAAMVP